MKRWRSDGAVRQHGGGNVTVLVKWIHLQPTAGHWAEVLYMSTCFMDAEIFQPLLDGLPGKCCTDVHGPQVEQTGRPHSCKHLKSILSLNKIRPNLNEHKQTSEQQRETSALLQQVHQSEDAASGAAHHLTLLLLRWKHRDSGSGRPCPLQDELLQLCSSLISF